MTGKSPAVKDAKDAAHAVVDKTKDVAHSAAEKIGNAAQSVAVKSKDTASPAEAVKEIAGNTVDATKDLASSAAEHAKGAAQTVFDTTKNVASATASKAGQAAQAVIDSSKNLASAAAVAEKKSLEKKSKKEESLAFEGFVNSKKWKAVTEEQMKLFLERRWVAKKKVLENVPEVVDGSGVACYHCQKAHMVKNCPYVKLNPKCFNCNRFGHMSGECKHYMTVRPGQAWQEFKDQHDITLARKSGFIGPAAAVCKKCGKHEHKYGLCIPPHRRHKVCYNCGKPGHPSVECTQN